MGWVSPLASSENALVELMVLHRGSAAASLHGGLFEFRHLPELVPPATGGSFAPSVAHRELGQLMIWLSYHSGRQRRSAGGLDSHSFRALGLRWRVGCGDCYFGDVSSTASA